MPASVQLLENVRRRLTDPTHWTTGAYARDTRGEPTIARSQHAVSWCVIGACLADMPTVEEDLLSTIYFLNHDIAGGSMTGYQDSMSHTVMLNMLNTAIDILKKDVEGGEQ